MKIFWIAVVLVSLVSMDSSAIGQLIPRRGTTRPCPTYKLPQADYQIDDRSKSAEAFSFRFIYLDNPLDKLNQQPNSGLKEKTELTTITTKKESSSGTSDAGLAGEISAAISLIDDARILAQERLLGSSQAESDIFTAVAAVNNARMKAEEGLLESGMTSDDISAAMSAIDSARLTAEEALLTSVNQSTAGISEAIARVKAQRSLVQEKLLKSGKMFTIEAAPLRVNETLLGPAKTAETIKKKTQIFESTPDAALTTVQRDQKLFQWSENRLKIDHCEISNMAVQLSRSGEWRLNLRADQNRRVPSQRFNPSLHIKRNQFGIVLRCYGNMDSARKVSSLTVGQPVLAEIKVDKFWVQNGKPNFFVTSKNDPFVAQNFDSIDRVEIEFFYYK